MPLTTTSDRVRWGKSAANRMATAPLALAPTMCAESTPALSITWLTNLARLGSECSKDCRMPHPWQIRADQPILLGHARHPRVPFRARFEGAMDQYHRLGLFPRLAQPVFPIEMV